VGSVLLAVVFVACLSYIVSFIFLHKRLVLGVKGGELVHRLLLVWQSQPHVADCCVT
jgi:hypothetical protein